jgi:hypothetical protein
MSKFGARDTGWTSETVMESSTKKPVRFSDSQPLASASFSTDRATTSVLELKRRDLMPLPHQQVRAIL